MDSSNVDPQKNFKAELDSAPSRKAFAGCRIDLLESYCVARRWGRLTGQVNLYQLPSRLLQRVVQDASSRLGVSK